MGSKYIFTPNKNPPPGYYDINMADKLIKTLSPSTIIRQPIHNVPKLFEYTPAPGEYDGHLKPIGAFLNKITMGSKYEFKADSNPGPGYYEPTNADGITKSKS